MKNLFLFVFIIFMSFQGFSQDEKNLNIFKFNPLQLATSSLSFSIESFNKEKDRSNNFTLGLRYRNDLDNYNYGQVSSTGTILEQKNDWKGLTGVYERRFYVPKFKDGKPNFINTESSQNGIYLAPSLRVDYTYRDYNLGYFEYQYDNTGKIISETTNYNSGKVSYLGVMPSINLGVQFSIFQYGYIDLFVGGGLRVQFEDEKEIVRSNNSGYFGNGSNIITDLVLNQGVRPNGGISVGVRL
ncbi:hypothetical protein SAMN06298216_3843 [Spirosomataceae bacterium TFI 002]|nr:hypothetical protein SAMN06298216_3843 [Spirosomataceae bacterium TFI 002]